MKIIRIILSSLALCFFLLDMVDVEEFLASKSFVCSNASDVICKNVIHLLNIEVQDEDLSQRQPAPYFVQELLLSVICFPDAFCISSDPHGIWQPPEI